MATGPGYPFEVIDDGGVKKVAEGIYWVRMPLPFPPTHINLWLLEDGDGWTVVDTGLALPEVQDYWRQVLDQLTGGRPIKRAIVTHFHPDHMGNAGWFGEHYGAELWVTQDEWLMGRLLAMDTSEETIDNTGDFLYKADIDQANIQEVKNRGAQYNNMVTLIPRRFHRMYDGDIVDINGVDWQVIVGLGHSPEHGCLYSEALKVIISGDQILPRITPIVGVHPMEPDGNPLADFLTSLKKFWVLHPETLGLPAHGLPFTGVLERLRFVDEHHRENLAILLDSCKKPITAREGVKFLFHRELNAQTLRMATTETLSHFNMLINQGLVARSERDDGIWEYVAI